MNQVYTSVCARLFCVSRRGQIVVAAHGQVKVHGRGAAVGEHRGISSCELHGLANQISGNVEGERSCFIGVPHGPVDIEFKVGHAQRNSRLIRVGLVGQSRDRPTGSGRHDSAHGAHRRGFVHNLIRSHHHLSRGQIHPSQVSNWHHPTSACDLNLPCRVGFPNHLSIHLSLDRQPRHAQIFSAKIRQIGGPLIAIGSPCRHVRLEQGQHIHCGVIRFDLNQRGPPVAGHKHEAIATKFGLEHRPQHGQAIDHLPCKGSIVLASLHPIHISNHVSIPTKRTKCPRPGRHGVPLSLHKHTRAPHARGTLCFFLSNDLPTS